MLEKTFEQILDLKEVQIDAVHIEETSIHIHCSSIVEESLCPSCLKKQRAVNQTYERKIRDLAITGREVYLHLTERQFYCPDCKRHFSERFGFVESGRSMTKRYEKYVYGLCKGSTLQQVSGQENIIWNTLDEIFKRNAKKEVSQLQSARKVKVLGMDEFSLKKGHKDFATVIVDLERVEIIDVLEYREKDKLIEYFNNKSKQWREGIEVFCSDMWDGFISTAKEVFPNATIIVDRFHFFSHLNKAIDNQRKQLRKLFKDNEDFKSLKWALLKNKLELSSEEKRKLRRAFAISPELEAIYEHKEELRSIFERDLSRKEAEIMIEQWLKKANSLNNKYLNRFIKTFTNWKNYVLNYFPRRFTTSTIEGINNTIKTIKRMCYGFRNFESFRYRILLNFI
jgi:transposase